MSHPSLEKQKEARPSWNAKKMWSLQLSKEVTLPVGVAFLALFNYV